MGTEIERRFLVNTNDDSFNQFIKCAEPLHISQGYICNDSNAVVRVRRAVTMRDGDFYYITVKISSPSIVTPEYEYKIPKKDGQDLIHCGCKGSLVEKTRYKYKHPIDGKIWDVDVFDGDNNGLVIAEVELEDENESIEIAPWIKSEITGMREYSNLALSQVPMNMRAK